MSFHRYPVSLQTVILGNNGGKDVLEIKTYPREENVLLLHVTFYAPGMRCSLVSFVYEISFLFSFHLNVLNIVHNGNSFSHVTLKGFSMLWTKHNIFDLCHIFNSVLGILDLTMRVKIELPNYLNIVF